MNKRLLVVTFSIIMLFTSLLSGCGIGSKVDTSYEEWADYIELNKRDNLVVEKYEEDDNHITVFFDYKGKEGAKEFAALVDAHNKFVDENPDYFSDGMSVCFSDEYSKGGSKPGVAYLSSNDGYSLDDNRYGGNMIIKYFAGDEEEMSIYTECLEDTTIEVPVLILQLDSNPKTTVKSTAFAYLSKFTGVQKVILDFQTEEDYEKFVNYVKQYQPDADVEVYYWHEKVDL